MSLFGDNQVDCYHLPNTYSGPVASFMQTQRIQLLDSPELWVDNNGPRSLEHTWIVFVVNEDSAVMTIRFGHLYGLLVCIHPIQTVTHPVESDTFYWSRHVPLCIDHYFRPRRSIQTLPLKRNEQIINYFLRFPLMSFIRYKWCLPIWMILTAIYPY